MKDGGHFVQKNVSVKNGKIKCSFPKELLIYHNYFLSLTLSHPHYQKVTFLDKAGKEYENLGGNFIFHAGIDSELECNIFFNIKDIKESSHT